MHVRKRTIAGVVAGALTVFGMSVVASNVADAAQPVPGHTAVVPDTPRTDVPMIDNGEISDIEVIGNRVYIAGSFTRIRNTTGNTAWVTRRGLAAYDYTTRQVLTGFNPTFDGGVSDIEASPDGSALFVTGSFNTVGGVTKRKIAKLNPTTGAPITAFTAQANARGTALDVSANAVYVGGQFTAVNGTTRVGLVALNPTTGAVDTGFNNQISGGIGVGGLLTVQHIALTHNDRKLLVVHTGRQIAGQDRYGVGLIDTQTKTLLPWRTRLWDDNLAFVGGIQRVFAGDISPDDTYFVVSSGSGGDRPPINDTVIRFPIEGGDNVEPTWISRHFDSIYSVAITERAIYAGGHFSWQESPTSTIPWPGRADVGYGTGQGLSGYGLGDEVVRRDHLGALDPATGTAIPWNPGSTSFEGEKAMKAVGRGLFVGGDGNNKGGKNVGRVAFFDLTQLPAASPVETTIDDPIEGRVKAANEAFTVSGQATAPAGISRVQVEIQNRQSSQWLQDDLVTWGASNTINTTVASVNATSSAWSIDLTLPAGEYKIQAKTFGRNSTSDPSKAIRKFETFSFDDLPPTTRITGPSAGLIATTAFTVTGTATDDVGVNAVTLSFRDEAGRYLQDDGAVLPNFNTFRLDPDVPGATTVNWSYDVVLPTEGEWRAEATAIDTANQSDLRGEVRDWIVSSTGQPPTVAITSPVAMTPPTTVPAVVVAPGTVVTFAGTAADEEELKSVEIFLRNNTTREALASDGTWSVNSIASYYRISPINLNAPTYNWSYTTQPLSAGTYDFRVRATDNLELTTTNTNSGRLTLNVQVPGDAFPDGRVTPIVGSNEINVLHLDLAGTATDDFGVSAVRVALLDRDTNRYLQPNGSMAAAFATRNATLDSPGGTSTNWSLPIDLPTQGEWRIEAWAVDTSDQQDGSTSGATATFLVYPNDDGPTLSADLFLPSDGTTFTAGQIVASGRAIDNLSTANVQVNIVNSLGQSMSSTGAFTSTTVRWISTFLTSPGSPGSNYAYTSPVIPAGTYTLNVRASDAYGQIGPVTTVTVNVTGP
jgi:trimeric autotransporter adhesin